MKNKFISLALTVAVATAFVLFAGCKKPDGATKPDNVDYYTCTMHPSVKSKDPKAKCPICSMDLVPVKKKPGQTSEPAMGEKGHDHAKRLAEQAAGMGKDEGKAMPGTEGRKTEGEEQPGEFTVPSERQQQIGVTYAAIEKRPFTHTVRAVGTVAYDKQRHWDYVARVDGYVQKLSVFSRGELVEKDAPLLTIYSPDLLTTQNEFVDMLRMRDVAKTNGNQSLLESTGRLVASAKRRLQLWNISDAEIAALEKTRKAQEHLTLYSPFKGVVQDIPVDQGRRVMMGDHLVDVADLSVVWVWAQFYQDELPMLKKGLAITLTTASYPGEKFEGKISLIDPFINDATRTGRVRIDVENPDFKLRPDMYVDAALTMDMGVGLAVPVDAVLPTGKHHIAFLDKGQGKLEPRFVELGRQYGENYEVKSGLKEGERVVTSANFLIDAEAKVQGALKSW